MTDVYKKKIEIYLNNITIKCKSNMKIVNNPIKITDQNFVVPTVKSYNVLVNVYVLSRLL